jgi:3-oxoacyl-[acyl-carrier protein] reductase
MNSYDLKGRVSIVTGGAGGFGKAIARRMMASGAAVELWDLDEASLNRAANELAGEGTKPGIRVVSVTDDAGVAHAVQACLRERGRIDILVNNAGILGEVKPIQDTDPANFRRVIDVNLVGTYLVTRSVVRAMLAQEPKPSRGRIVNISSIQGKEGLAFASAYAASKAGVIALTKVVAKETAKDGIVVTAVTPAAALTAMAEEMTPQRRADILSRIPAGRFVEVDEIARLVTWLSSDDCSFSTGGIFDISGGRATY